MKKINIFKVFLVKLTTKALLVLFVLYPSISSAYSLTFPDLSPLVSSYQAYTSSFDAVASKISLPKAESVENLQASIYSWIKDFFSTPEVIEPEVPNTPITPPPPPSPIIIRNNTTVNEESIISLVKNILSQEYSLATGPRGPQGIPGPQGPRGPQGSTPDLSSYVTYTSYDKQVEGLLRSIEDASEGISQSIATQVSTASLITPLIIGGNTPTSDLTFKTTSVGGATGADMHFLVGNNGATEAMTILNDGKVGIGTTAPAQQLEISQNFRMPSTTFASPYGIIYKGTTPFIHDFNYGSNGSVTTDGFNTFVGISAGNLTMGSTASQYYHASYNTALGYNSLRFNTTGFDNTATGYISLTNNSTGYYNTAYGAYSLHVNTTGYQNTVGGVATLYSNSTGYNNTAFGYEAGRFIADGATGNQTSNNSLYLGYGSRALANGGTNEIVIGASTIGKGSNTTNIGNSSITKFFAAGDQIGIGTSALSSLTSGSNNVGLGYEALYGVTTGGHNFATGYRALKATTGGSYNIAIGSNAAKLNNSSYNIALGMEALGTVSTGQHNTAIGGQDTLALTNGTSNTAVGSVAMRELGDGSYNSALGHGALRRPGSGSHNIGIGYLSAYYLADGVTAPTSLNNSIYIGNNTRSGDATAANEIVIGDSAIGKGDNSTSIGNSSVTKFFANGSTIGIGTSALSALTSGTGNVAIGYETLKDLTTVSNLVAVGYQALRLNTTGNENTAVGYLALAANTQGEDNTAFGSGAGYQITTGSYNTAIGKNSLASASNASNNTAVGQGAGMAITGGQNTLIGANAGESQWNVSSGAGNVAVGYNAMKTTGGATISSNNNTVIGSEAAYNHNSIGANNVALGYNAITNEYDGTPANVGNTFTNNIHIGADVKVSGAAASNEIAIGYSAIGAGSNSVTLGNDSITKTILKGNVGIGTTAPYDTLDIVSTAGHYAFIGGNSTGDYGVRIGPNASGWATIQGFRRSDFSVQNLTLQPDSGSVGIGVVNPTGKLQVTGSIYSNSASTNTVFNGTVGIANANFVGTGGYWALRTAVNNSYNLDVYNSGSPLVAMTVLQSGNVGIGITNPGAKLNVYGTGTTATILSESPTNANPSFKLKSGANTWAISQQDTFHSGNLLFNFGGTDYSTNALEISTGGSVGIGTTAPADLLHLTTGNIRVGASTATRATTAGTNQLILFDGTAPVGTLANGISMYSTAGEAYIMDAAGNATLQSPHENENNYWVFDSRNAYTGKTLIVDMELLIKDINDSLELDYVHETIDGEASPRSEGTILSKLFSKISLWLADAGNGIVKIFTNEIETKSLCVSDESGAKTCITKSELDALILNSGGSPSSGGGGSSEPIPEAPPTIEEPIASTTIDPTVEEPSATETPSLVDESVVTPETPVVIEEPVSEPVPEAINIEEAPISEPVI